MIKQSRKVLALVMAIIFVAFALASCTNGGGGSAPAPGGSSPAAPPAGSSPATPPPPTTDFANFTIDPAQIPADKLSTTVYAAVSIRGLENPYIATIKDGMDMFTAYLDTIGQKYNSQVLDSGGDSNKEVDNMKQFAAKAGGDCIAYSDPNENAIAQPLAQAVADAGGYIGTAWNKPDDVGPMDLTPNWVIHTSPDNVANGYAIAKLLFDNMGGKGKIFVTEGMLGNTAAIDRAKGLDKALAEYPNITVANRDTANWDTAQALTLVETWLSKDPDVGGIWCANDNMATGALQALDKAGLKGKVGVVGIDANTDIVQAVADGNAVATVSSNGYLQGGYTLAICYAAWTGLLDVASLPADFREFATPATVITKDNAQAYLSAKPSFDFSKPFACRVDPATGKAPLEAN